MGEGRYFFMGVRGSKFLVIAGLRLGVCAEVGEDGVKIFAWMDRYVLYCWLFSQAYRLRSGGEICVE